MLLNNAYGQQQQGYTNVDQPYSNQPFTSSARLEKEQSRGKRSNCIDDPNDASTFQKADRLVKSFYGIVYTPENSQYPECGNKLGACIVTSRLRISCWQHISAYVSRAMSSRDGTVNVQDGGVYQRVVRTRPSRVVEIISRTRVVYPGFSRRLGPLSCHVSMLLDDAALENRDLAVDDQRNLDVRYTANSLLSGQAQTDINAVINTSRLPTPSNRSILHYVDHVAMSPHPITKHNVGKDMPNFKGIVGLGNK
ncbi:hypothetical protein K466DRAFT_636324 [Polyporus arcularius HHB13444]|uniref:Uncharacterized protein n=1 Tax=Polyporus arcularius HHB13444 TaxID=1314778 RepID=A0A5C3PN39_9APHY|nr:hypothetical protein K466DRAFT_636324 [Polyporus arcularius HHB13444]